MTSKRIAGTLGVAFLVSQILAIVVHGVILAEDYQPFRGSLLRTPEQMGWQALLLPVSHVFFISALLWVYLNVRLDGSRAMQGLKLGLLGWFAARGARGGSRTRTVLSDLGILSPLRLPGCALWQSQEQGQQSCGHPLTNQPR